MRGLEKLQRWTGATGLRGDLRDSALLVLIGLALIAVDVVDVVGAFAPLEALTSRWWHTVPLILGGIVLLAKRHRPGVTLAMAVVLLATDVAIGGSISVYLVLLDALYSFVRYIDSSWVRPTLITVGVVVTAIPAGVFIVSGNVDVTVGAAIQSFALLATPVWWGWSLRQESRLVEVERRRAEAVREVSELRRATAVRDERSRMAQDLHDGLSSNLSTIAIHSSAALARQPGGGAPDPALTEIRQASVRALEDLREMIQLLHTGSDPITPAARLDDLDLVIRSARGTGLTVRVDGNTGDLPPLPSVVEQAAYRIVQESLANAAKHAPGSDVMVTLRIERDPDGDDAAEARGETSAPPSESTLELIVRSVSHGTGPSDPLPVSGSGLGLQTMRARAAALGGRFTAGWRGNAWLVNARLPTSPTVTTEPHAQRSGTSPTADLSGAQPAEPLRKGS